MLEEIKDINSGKRELRQFGIIVGIVLGLWAGLFLLRGRDYYFYFLSFSVVILFLGLVAPTLLRPIQKAGMSLAILIGWVLTRVLLTILFYFVVTPIGILARIFGKRFLDIQFKPDADSYWMTKVPAEIDKRSLENQF